LENIDLHYYNYQSKFLLANISTRMGLIQEARDRLSAALQDSTQISFQTREAYRLQAEAEIASAEQNWDQAISSCQALIDIYLQGGYRWKWARHLIDLGDAHLGRGGTSDRAQAEQAYRQSLEMFTEMGATGYVKVLEERLGG
jgi:tetratricopeptide (TPR) repeat protein